MISAGTNMKSAAEPTEGQLLTCSHANSTTTKESQMRSRNRLGCGIASVLSRIFGEKQPVLLTIHSLFTIVSSLVKGQQI